MSRVIHFEIQAGNPERALKFYGDVFGWKAQKWDGPEDYWLLMTGEEGEPGINGGLMNRCGPEPAEGSGVSSFVCTVDVDSVDACIETVNAYGGSVAVPKTAVPGVGYMAYCKDTESNVFGVMQMDASAGKE